jgi:ornithine cyclodeaminase
VLVVGTGAQARAHLAAFAVTHPDAELQLFGRNPAAAAEIAAEHGAASKADLEQAVRSADIVVLCTSSLTPVIEDAWVTDGTTVASVGSFAPDRVELPPSLLARSTVVVDHRPSALTDSGPVVEAVVSGSVDPDRVVDLGSLLADNASPDRSPTEVVVYLSVGVGVQDAAAAEAILATAEKQDVGTQTALD